MTNLEYNQIYNMDCLEGLKLLSNESIDFMITSPPYNIGYRLGNKKYDEYEDNLSENDYLKWSLNIFKLLEKKIKSKGVIVYNMSYSTNNPSLMYKVVNEIISETKFNVYETVVWEKNQALPNSSSPNRLTRICELCFVFSKDKNFNMYKKYIVRKKTNQKYYKNYYNKLKTNNNDECYENHKATFSSNFVKWFLKLYTKENDLVLDIFMGTGTTAISCKELNRRYIGFEIFKKYCDISQERIKKINNKKLNDWFK